MYINKVDELLDKLIDKFYDYLIKNKIFEQINKDTNFVRFQNLILDTIKKFVSLEVKDTFISNIIKKYCAYYIYLGIGYYYKGGRDLFITNIIETSKNQKDSIISIENFFNSYTNSKIINFFKI